MVVPEFNDEHAVHQLRFTFSKDVSNSLSDSSVQVRKPVSTQAIGRWKHYRSHLAPLFKALGHFEEGQPEARPEFRAQHSHGSRRSD